MCEKLNIEIQGNNWLHLTAVRTMNSISMEQSNREAEVGFLIQADPNIINEANIHGPQIIAINLKIHGLNIRLTNVYSTTESDSGKNEKY